ncbi:conserved hypothetical protein [Vibrio phage 277E43-1]|nr:conserved hypothetical protein [Vibrio phage 277E43-1]
MKLQKIYSDEVQSALDQLELIISERKDAIEDRWDSMEASTQKELSDKSDYVFGKHSILVWIADDGLIQECREEIKRILSVSVPVKYSVEYDHED